MPRPHLKIATQSNELESNALRGKKMIILLYSNEHNAYGFLRFVCGLL